MANSVIDWSTFAKTRPLTLEDLRRFSSADLDPYTVQIAQALCERFTFSSNGHKNLSFAFTGLGDEGRPIRGSVEMGFSDLHAFNTTLKTDSGFLLTSLLGLLTEYYRLDFVVEFFRLLRKHSNVPEYLNPIESQWRKMVDVLSGVLSRSTFGLLLAQFEELCPTGLQKDSPSAILNALNTMSDLVKRPGAQAELATGAELIWVASVAEWVFDLKICIQSQARDEIYKSPGVQESKNVNLTLRLSGSAAKAVSASQTGLDDNTLSPSDTQVISGGRVAYKNLFKSCFRDAISTLDENLLAAYLSAAARILQDSLVKTGVLAQHIFLGQASDVPGTVQHGLVETITAWFPELERLKPRFKQYKNLSDEEVRKLFDEKVSELQNKCVCEVCRPDIPASAEFCKVTLGEVIVNLGLNIARMVVSPKLYPKRGGVITFYHRHHSTRKNRSTDTSTSTSEDFVKTVVDLLPSPWETIDIAFMLFANVNTNAGKLTMGMTAAGLTVFINGRGEVYNTAKPQEKDLFIGVGVVPGWLCLYGHEAKLEVYDKGLTDWTLDHVWDVIREDPKGFHQIMKWKDEAMLFSIIPKDNEMVKRAEDAGWLMI